MKLLQLLALASVLLVACGNAAEPCSPRGVRVVTSDVPLDCEAMANVVWLAHRALREAGVSYDVAEFADVAVHLEAAPWARYVEGQYEANGPMIRLVAPGTGLAHEMGHHLNHRRGWLPPQLARDAGPDHHANFADAGFYEAQAIFEQRFSDPTRMDAVVTGSNGVTQ